MDSNIIDSIVENLFSVLPLIRRKLLKIDLEAASKDISRLHFAVMGMLDAAGTLPISEIGKRLLIPKPQMTHLIDQLVGLGIVERLRDTRDRRIINITLTDKGKITLGQLKELVRNNIRKKLSSLNDEELEELSACLGKLIDIGSRLE